MAQLTVDPELDRKISRVKVDMMGNKKCSFVTAIVLNLEPTWADDLPCWAGQEPTAATEGVKLYLAPTFVEKQTDRKLAGLFAHEALHVAMHHCMRDRMGDRQWKLWSIACDYWVNARVVWDMGLEIPDGGYIDAKYKGDEWTVELIYDDLEKQQQQGKKFGPPNMQDLIMVDPGQTEDGQGGQGTGATMRDKVNRILAQAATMERQIHGGWGHLPGDIQIFLENLFNPKVPWDQLYRNHMDTYAKQDYSYRKPNKRMLPTFYMPTLYSEKVSRLAFLIDSSYSVTDNAFQSFLSEIHYARVMLEPEETIIVTFDTKVRDIYVLDEYQSLYGLKFTGRGGTDIHPAFEYFKDNPPDVLTVFSDLECRPLDYVPPFPVIWIKIGKHGFNPEFGEVIEYEPEQPRKQY